MYKSGEKTDGFSSPTSKKKRKHKNIRAHTPREVHFFSITTMTITTTTTTTITTMRRGDERERALSFYRSLSLSHRSRTRTPVLITHF
jgi:hypothetical protein